uniref:Uncharacterized protein n=1 Tax=Alexandrium andersonii TaxID=327968 RepID=A0A7S2IV51_9DINO
MTPECFGKVLRDGVAKGELAFTAKADVEVVTEQYSKAFEAAFSFVAELNYAALRWSDEQMKSLAQAITYAREHGGLTLCNEVDVTDNDASEAGLLALIDALAGAGCLLDARSNHLWSKAGEAAVRKAAEDNNVKVYL